MLVVAELCNCACIGWHQLFYSCYTITGPFTAVWLSANHLFKVHVYFIGLTQLLWSFCRDQGSQHSNQHSEEGDVALAASLKKGLIKRASLWCYSNFKNHVHKHHNVHKCGPMSKELWRVWPPPCSQLQHSLARQVNFWAFRSKDSGWCCLSCPCVLLALQLQ